MGTGRLSRTLKGHSEHVRLIAFNSDSRVLVSASFDNAIKVWRLP
ncbi:MAG: WD40 domain-containing protein [Kastovskya adunca ATA6-11-RM4]|nr:WD40 domain-containing protein [Kastovskya adunca ATA6-11-RM4]